MLSKYKNFFEKAILKTQYVKMQKDKKTKPKNDKIY